MRDLMNGIKTTIRNAYTIRWDHFLLNKGLVLLYLKVLQPRSSRSSSSLFLPPIIRKHYNPRLFVVWDSMEWEYTVPVLLKAAF